MAALTISLSTLLYFALTFIFLYCIYFLYELFILQPRRFGAFWNGQGVKGPAYSFPLGQLPDIQKAAEKDATVEYSQQMAEEWGLIQTQYAGPICHVIVYDPELCRHIFTTKAHCYHKASDAQKEILRPLLHNGLLLSEDSYWKQQRALLSPGFHFWYLQEMVPIIDQCIEGWVKKVEKLIDASSSSDKSIELEMSHEMATMTLDSVATAAFGSGFRSDPARADLFIHSLKQVLDNMQYRTLNLLGFIPFLKKMPFKSLRLIQEGCQNIDDIVAAIVRDRKEGRTKVIAGGEHAGTAKLRAENNGSDVARRDLLDLLLDAQQNMPEGQVLTDRGIEEESINFIAAGAETTSNLCIWMLYRIMSEPPVKNPDGTMEKTIYEKVRDEIDIVCGTSLPTIDMLKDLKYLEAVIYESLRLHPPAPTIPKHAMEDHEISLSGNRKIFVPKGTTFLISTHVIHRLEQYWPEHEVFKPERFLTGAGGVGNEDDNATTASSSSSSSTTSSSSSTTNKSPLSADEKLRRAAAPFAYLGFSAGPRKCIGKNLAMLEIKIIFTLLLQHFTFDVVPGQYIAAHSITRLPKNGIKMNVKKRVRSAEEVRRMEELHAAHTAGAEAASSSSSTDESNLRQRTTAATTSVIKPLGMI